MLLFYVIIGYYVIKIYKRGVNYGKYGLYYEI